MRASDVERERCARLLHGAYAEGRMSVEELERRLERVHAAGSRTELVWLARDVPKRHAARVGAAVDRIDRAALKLHGGVAALVNGALIGVWELTGQGWFWPAIVLVPTALLLGAHWLSSWTVRRLVRRIGLGSGSRG
jgi:NAD(P)-dependent dehydrogenase (short-subunit alcohol dehydrogenase family)